MHSVNAATNQGFNDNPVGLVFQKHAVLRVKGASRFYENTQKSNVKTEEKFKKARFHRRFSYKTTPSYALRFTRLRTLAKLSPMIVKTFL